MTQTPPSNESSFSSSLQLSHSFTNLLSPQEALSVCLQLAASLVFASIILSISYAFAYYASSKPLYNYFNPTYQFNISTDLSSLIPLNSSTPLSPDDLKHAIIFDTHLHTTGSDGLLSIPQIISYSRAQGFNAIFITDHQTAQTGISATEYLKSHPANDDGFFVVVGEEYTCCRIHMNFYGISQTVAVAQAFPTDQELQEAIQQVHNMGGLVVVNHLPWSLTLEPGQDGLPRLPQHPSREQLLTWGVDGFEVVSGDTFDYATFQFCLQHNLIMVSGSDTHQPLGTYGWNVLTLKPDEQRNASTILRGLREHHHHILYQAEGLIPPSVSFPQRYGVETSTPIRDFLEPVVSAGQLVMNIIQVNQGMYSFVPGQFCHPKKVIFYPWLVVATLWWIGVCFVLYILSEVLLRTLWNRIRIFWKGRKGLEYTATLE